MRRLRTLALAVPAIRRLRDARDHLLKERDDLQARLDRGAGGPKACCESPASRFFHCNAAFDPQEVMRRHAVSHLVPRPGYLTNFLGVVIDPKFLPVILDGRAGQVEEMPIPANWHADIAEWGAALRAVDLARGTFTVAELGCGWGCWLNNTGVAARRAGLDVRLIGVEGDKGHIGFAREACDANGFQGSQVTLHNAIAAATSGTALFPKQEKVGMAWGLEPVFGATDAQRRNAVRTGGYDELPMLALADLARPHARIDLLHVDIQGGEADLIADTLDLLRNKVAYLLVGTHSRQIEGRIFDLLLGAGWRLEIERPAILELGASAVAVSVDGVQGWRNPVLLPEKPEDDAAPVFRRGRG